MGTDADTERCDKRYGFTDEHAYKSTLIPFLLTRAPPYIQGKCIIYPIALSLLYGTLFLSVAVGGNEVEGMRIIISSARTPCLGRLKVRNGGGGGLLGKILEERLR